MKKFIIIGLSIFLCMSLLSGCENIPSEEPVDNDSTAERMQCDMNAEYYMLSIAPFDMDVDLMLPYLTKDYNQHQSAVVTSTEEINDVGLSDTRYDYEVIINERDYGWTLSTCDSSYFVWRTKLASEPDYHGGIPVEDYETADCLVEDLLKTAGIEAQLYSKEKYPLIGEDGNTLSYRFYQSFEEVPIADVMLQMGGQHIEGPFMEVDMDGSGFRLVAFHDLVQVEDVLKTYSSAEFLEFKELENRAEAYNKSFLANVGSGSSVEVDVTIKEAQIVYIPSLEKNQMVLIPAYCLVMEETWEKDHIRDGKYRYIMDVFTGYVYERMMLSE